MRIVEASFQTLPKEQTREIVATIEQVIPAEDRVIALDRVLANLDKSQIVPKNVEGIKADPPTIFFSKTPAVMVNLDGEPIWSPIRDNDLKFAVNTNWDLFQHVPSDTLYLRHEKSWLKAAEVKGPWSPAGALPESFKKLPADDNWKDVKASLPGAPLAAAAVPAVFVSFIPAELILTTRRAALRARAGHRALVGQQHRERRVPDGEDGLRSTTWSRGAGSRRPTSPVPGDSRRRRCPRTSRRFRSSTSGRASSRPCPARIRRSRRCCSPRFRRPRASTRRS